jgi:xanthine dehydrogenase/oxidase
VEGGLDMANIKVQTTTSVIANNVGESGGSVTSELCAMAVQVACNKLVERLRVTSRMLTTLCGKPSWHELIEAALTSGIDLQARGRIYPGPNQNGPFQ